MIGSDLLCGRSAQEGVGTGFLIQTTRHQRRDVVLTAAHNLVHLQKEGIQEVHFTLYRRRDVYTIGARADDSLRYAIPQEYFDHGTTVTDFGVMVLAEPVPDDLAPLPLAVIEEDFDGMGVVAGCLSHAVQVGDRAIYQSTVHVMKESSTSFYYDQRATEKGMSGGPVLASGAAIGIISGTGQIRGIELGLAAPISASTYGIIEGLIEAALHG